MRRLLLLLLVPLCGCPSPEPVDCNRTLIDQFGTNNGGFAGGFGGSGGSGGFEEPLGLVGTPLRFTVFAPLSACEPDVLRADATVLDPDNAPVDFTLEGALARSGLQNAVSGTFSFTPRKPGIHTLRVAFEPSLGVRSVLVDVAADGSLGPSTKVPLPEGVTCTVWPLTDDTVACEEPGGLVSISSADAGVLRFDGAELVVVDDVLWSIDATNTLERRVFADGGLRVTHRVPGFPVTATPALHDVDVALRYRSNGLITRVRITDGGVVSVGDFAVDRFLDPVAYFIEPDDSLFRWSSQDCFSTPCTNFSDVVALERGLVWRASNGFDARGGVSAFERPFRLPPNARFSLNRAPLTNRIQPTHGFERIPLWLEATTTDRRFLVSADDGTVSFSAWPSAQVLNIGRHHIVVSDQAGVVRVFRR